jgi:hypothetical protein
LKIAAAFFLIFIIGKGFAMTTLIIFKVNFKQLLRGDPFKKKIFPYGKKLSEADLNNIYTPLIKDVIEDIRKLNR